MSLSVAVMAMKEREIYVDELLGSLDGQAVVVWDEKRDRYDTGRRALLAHRSLGATHHLVLQDDAVVCRDLLASVEQATQRIPDNPICLYYGHGINGAHQRTNAMAAAASRPSLLCFEGPWWGVAVVFPTSLIERILKHADRPQKTPAYDKRLSRALQRMRVDTYYVLPSLVDHRLDGPSMIPGRAQAQRHAHHFIGKDASALDIDWYSLPVIDGHRSTQVLARGSVAAPSLTMKPRPWQGTPKLGVAVMAHPKRQQMAEGLGSRLGAKVVYDTQEDRWDTGRRAWLAAAAVPGVTHAVVLQDDAIPADDLRGALGEALRVVGDNPLGLYLGTVRPTGTYMAAMVAHAKTTKASWVVGEGPLWGVGVTLPIGMVQPMLDWCDTKPHIAAYDRRMAAYFKQVGIDCWYPMPSLVDHREGPSLVQKHRSPTRRARFFLPDASGVDWTRLPHTTGQRYVTFTGAAARRFYRCLSCGFYTPMRHSITRHIKECTDPEARMSHATV